MTVNYSQAANDLRIKNNTKIQLFKLLVVGVTLKGW